MQYLLLFFTPVIVFAQASFITPMEYASQLYKNPRGIGCNKCHGERGEGKIIANYVHKKQQKSFTAPSINTLDFKSFSEALNKRLNGMPRYFLTEKEIKSLYFYLQEQKSQPVAKKGKNGK
jgi:mono/diheme cytochrome c family protein